MAQKMKVCNNSEYNTYLIKRGQFFSLINEIFDKWYFNGPKKKGRPFIYSDDLIIVINTIRHILKFPLRQIRGFFIEFVAGRSDLKVPSHTQLSRRFRKLNLKINDYRKDKNNSKGLEIAIDSTGINIYHNSDGHGKKNREKRKYKHYQQLRKLHVGIDCVSKMALSVAYSGGTKSDHLMFNEIIDDIKGKIDRVICDRAYSKKKCYYKAYEKKIKPIIPTPTIGVVQRDKNKKKYLIERDKIIQYINQYDSYKEGLKEWKKEVSYGKRAHIEGFFSRFKRIFGFHFTNKSEEARRNELIMKTNILNSYTNIGMAKFVKIA